MRLTTYLSTLLFSFFLIFNLQARTCNCIVDGGDWGTPTTWDCPGGPQAGDTVNIPAGITVNVNNVYTYTGDAMYINVDGTIHLGKPGSKLFFPCGSIVYFSETGELTIGKGGGGSSREVHICDAAWWTNVDGPVVGIEVWGIIIPLSSIDYNFYIVEQDGKPNIRFNITDDNIAEEIEILRATNNSEFETINNSELKSNVSFTDNNPEFGTNYYKINLIGKSGIQETTIISFVRENTALFYPNPVRNELNINIENERQFKSVKVISITGELVHQSNIAKSKIDVSEWDTGIYLIQIEHENNITTNRLVVQ